jgi:hypothetical protein
MHVSVVGEHQAGLTVAVQPAGKVSLNCTAAKSFWSAVQVTVTVTLSPGFTVVSDKLLDGLTMADAKPGISIAPIARIVTTVKTHVTFLISLPSSFSVSL